MATLLGDFRPPYLCMLDPACTDGAHSSGCKRVNDQRYEILLAEERTRRVETVRQYGIEP